MFIIRCQSSDTVDCEKRVSDAFVFTENELDLVLCSLLLLRFCLGPPRSLPPRGSGAERIMKHIDGVFGR
jgi:hypothetical protein